MKIGIITLKAAFLASSIVAAAGAAQAQQTPGAVLPGADVKADADEIIVTAMRRSARLEDVPASLTAVSGEVLSNSGVTRFQDLAIVAPAVQISRSGSYSQPAIRGVTTTFAGSGQETNVAIYVDGFYTSDQLSSNQDFGNVQDIQILKGPQGTLYGRNATGGAILITTRSPGSEFEASGSLSYSPTFNEKKSEIYVGGPLAQGISLGVGGYFRENDGYLKDINNFSPNAPIRFPDIANRTGNNSGPFKNWSIRPKLVIEPAAGVKITLGYVHSYLNDARSFGYRIIDHAPSPATQYNGYPIARAIDTTSLNFQPVNESSVDEFNVAGQFKIASLGTITSRSAYRTQRDFQLYDLDATPRDPVSGPGVSFTGVQYNRRKTFTQQLDYSGDLTDTLSVLAGAFYYRDRFKTPRGIDDTGGIATAFPFIPNPTLTTLRFDTSAWAVYLDGTLNFAKNFYLTVGGRYSEDSKWLERSRVDALGAPVNSESSITYYPGDGIAREKSTAFTPHIVLRYNVSPGTNIYGSISRGFKAGTINTAAPFNILKPEKVTAYEVGFKTNHGGLRAELSAFYYDYRDNQVAALSASTPSLSTLIQNSGGAKIYGADGMISYHISPAFSVRVALAYLHARYSDFDNATNSVVNPATGLNTSVIGSWSGRRIARAPDWSGSVGADYKVGLAGGELAANATATFSSRYAPVNISYQCAYALQGGINRCVPGTDSSQEGRFEENGYVLVNARIGWTAPGGKITLTAYANNLTNTRFKTSTVGLFYGDYIGLNEPRTFGGSISFKY
jgi:iron complex outermembrane receptor protein